MRTGQAGVVASPTARTGIKAYAFTVADHGACEAGVAAIIAELGPLDILVNNAGITATRALPN